MTVNIFVRTIATYSVNGPVRSALIRNKPNHSVNRTQFIRALRSQQSYRVNSDKLKNHVRNFKNQFLKQAAICLEISNQGITQFLKFLRLLSKQGLKKFRTEFRNISEKFPNQIPAQFRTTSGNFGNVTVNTRSEC